MTTINISPAAVLAIKAAHVRKTCGRYAASRFVEKNNVDRNLFRIACQLSAVSE